jgi:cell division protease FtsH
MAEIEEATIKVVAGPEKRSKVVTEKDKKLTSYHEAGHAVCTFYCPTLDPVHQVSIIPRGMAGGFTMSLPSEDRNYITKTHMYEEIVMMMGGRVAEQLVLDDISTGASNDLERATKTARRMVTRYGFTEALGPVVYGQDQGEVFLGRDYMHSRDFSEQVASEIDIEVRKLIDNAYLKTTEIITKHMDELHTVARYLYEHEKVEAEEFAQLMAGTLKPSPGLKMFGDPEPEPLPEASPEAPKEPQKQEQPPQEGDEPPGSRLDIEIN